MVLPRAPKALFFDVFGTCVDWRTTVTDALELGSHRALDSAEKSLSSAVRLKASNMTVEDWGNLAQEWRNTYKRFTKTLAADPSLHWKTIDDHHLDSIRELLAEWKLEGLWADEEVRALSLIWHRLNPWLDSSPGITELNRLFQTATLSNGNFSLLNDLTAHAQMKFTHIFSAELFGAYKPSPTVYLGAASALHLQPSDCAMVAAHLNDLKAAKSHGMQVIYVERPREEDWSKEEVEQARRDGWVDLWITNEEDGFLTMAQKLGVKLDEEMLKGFRAHSDPN
ncbi:haloacid dehalogenase [Lophium mytilinum]|uniref:Haloacid dehalogenase n=1 Tax=Lophium mytilinum TaxID=390894 RepID=A0A6A6QU44_9PEZI|nr:haloacid dehalogenase [Lophium mytilinum]